MVFQVKVNTLFSRFIIVDVAIVFRQYCRSKPTPQKIRLLGRAPNDSDPLLDGECYVKNCDSKMADTFRLLQGND